MKLEFNSTRNGGLIADFKGVKFIVYLKNAGYDWFIKYPDEKSFTPTAKGRKYNDELDCCCTTLTGTLEDMVDVLSSPTNILDWSINANRPNEEENVRTERLHRHGTSVFR